MNVLTTLVPIGSMNTRITSRIRFIACFVLLLATGVTHAALIIVDFEGVVVGKQFESSYPIFAAIQVGSHVSGRLAYDTDPDFYGGDKIGLPDQGLFEKDPARAIGLRVLKFSADSTVGPRLIQDATKQVGLFVVDDNGGSDDGDEFEISGLSAHPDFSYEIVFVDQSDQALSSDTIPSNLEDFFGYRLFILGTAAFTPNLVEVAISAFNARVVRADSTCAARLAGNAVDPDGQGQGIGAILPSGKGRFRQIAGNGPQANFHIVNVALECGTRLDVCLERGGTKQSRILVQQIFVCDADGLAKGLAMVDERQGSPKLEPMPDFAVTPLSTIDDTADNICEAVIGRTIRVRRSESRSSPCNEAVVLDGVIEDR